MRRITCLLGVLPLLLGCQSPMGETRADEVFLEHDTEIELFTKNAELICSDDYLAICSSETPVQLYSLPDLKLLTSYGSLGPGPEEFLLPSVSLLGDKKIGVNDLKNQSLSILAIHAEKDSLHLAMEKRLVSDEKRQNSVRSFIRVGDSHYAGVIAQKSGEFFALADSSLHTEGYFGESPVDDPLLEPYSSRQRLGNCRLASWGDSFVYSVKDLPYLAKYHLEDGAMKKDWSLFFDKTYFEVKNGDLLFSKDRTFGQVMAVQMDEDYIYVLYLDQLVSEYDYSNPEKSEANRILVFNHLGEQVSVMKLDTRISRMALNRKKKCLFGIARIPEPTLIKFELH